MALQETDILYTPKCVRFSLNGLTALVAPDIPHWVVTDGRGERILRRVDGTTPVAAIVRAYSEENGAGILKAWQHVKYFLEDALRKKFISRVPQTPSHYPGRGEYLKLEKLSELWLHTNNSCNLACGHCLVSSSPESDKGMPKETLVGIIDQGLALGVERFYFTGGEPFVRKDIYELIDYITNVHGKELAILTNGTLFRGERLRKLDSFSREKLRLQVSLDGSTAEMNDPIRGKGTFEDILAGIKNLTRAGWPVTVTTVVAAQNLDDISNVTELCASLGVKNHHLLWVHHRGRAVDGALDFTPDVDRLIAAVQKAKDTGDRLGVALDNFKSLKLRLRARAGVRHDLSLACWGSLCVYSDGRVYPSAATANHEGLALGSIHEKSLEEIWRTSATADMFRGATVEKKALCRDCHLKFLCGGGDIEHSYFYSESVLGHATPLGPDPYCELHKAMIKKSLLELGAEKQKQMNTGSGFGAPVVFCAMGEEMDVCGSSGNGSLAGAYAASGVTVRTVHSNCVLSYDLDQSRAVVREFYGKAAEEPQQEICCPSAYPVEDVGHIPKEVIERFYGCGSPIALAGIKEGETTLDLGSGAGIDCFISAKYTGRTGEVVGVDMTDEMLRVANECRAAVSENLGYDVVEFRKGFLEEIPVEAGAVDLITSNCVINLSPDKKKVFSEMWRVLRDHGRIVVSDVVSEGEIPPHIRTNDRLWGECIAGALSEEEFFASLERAGFYGLEVLKKVFWKNVEGHRFHSLTVRGYKFEKKAGCRFVGQKAVYLGPMKTAMDEEGHTFPRGEEVEICTDTAAKLSKPPYAGQFMIVEPAGERTVASAPADGAPRRTPDNPCC